MNIPGDDHYQKATRRSVGELATASLTAFLITAPHQRGGGGALMPTCGCGRKGSGAHTSLHPMTEGKYIHLCYVGAGAGAAEQQGLSKVRRFKNTAWWVCIFFTISVYYCLVPV